MPESKISAMHFSISPYGETYLPLVNRAAFEYHSSKNIFEQKYPDLLSIEDRLNIIVGMDSGLLANYLMSSQFAKGSLYIFVELDDVLQLMNIDIPDELQNVIKVISASELHNELSSDRNHIFISKKQFNIFNSLAAESAYLEQYHELKTFVNKAVERHFFEACVHLTQKQFVHKQLHNIVDNQYPAIELSQKFTGKTCVIVGGGPSLDDHLDWLETHQDSLFVFVASRAAYQVYQAGIHVDFVISVDPQDQSYRVSKDMLRLPETSIFIHADHVVQSLSGQWHSTQFYTGTRLPWQAGNNIATAGPTVSNAALSLAGAMGFTQILLLGVDLCWSPLGVSHASGSLEGQLGPDISKIGEWVQTNQDQAAETTLQMIEAIDSLGSQVEQLPDDTQVYNLAKHGAKIKGVTYIPTEQLILEKCEDKYQKLAWVHKSHPKIQDKQQLHQLIADLNLAKEQFDQILNKANQAQKLVDNLPESQSTIEQLEAELQDTLADPLKFLKFYGYEEFTNFLTTKDSQSWDQLQIKALTKTYYQMMSCVAEKLSGLIEEAINLVQMRIEELRSDADLNALYDHWINMKQPRRIEFWLARHQHTDIKDADQDLISQLKQRYHLSLQETLRDNQQIKLTRWALDKVPEKIHFLYLTKNATGLEQLIYALDNFQISDAAKQLSHRAKSFLYELKSEYQTAFDILNELPEHLRQEPETKQMALMALKSANLPAAESCLRHLMSISDEYMPKLAQVLKLQQDYQKAINIWLDYLDKYPQDSSNWCLLGEMLIELNEPQHALVVLQQALQADPENRLAKQYLDLLDVG